MLLDFSSFSPSFFYLFFSDFSSSFLLVVIIEDKIAKNILIAIRSIVFDVSVVSFSLSLFLFFLIVLFLNIEEDSDDY